MSNRLFEVPAGQRIYAIGDIHGRLDLLDALLKRIERDRRARPGMEERIVFLGDYIDCGPQSAQVLDRLLGGGEWLLLRGNHEQVMLDVFDGVGDAEQRLRQWLKMGGRETLRSYSMAPALAYGDDLDAIRAAIPAHVPPWHVAGLRAMPLSWRAGDYLFVHAGIRPGAPIERQKPSDLLWIREAFLDDSGDHGVMVVHGHTISRRIEERPNRIGIDTGAYRTGRLTALVVEGSARRYISTRPAFSIWLRDRIRAR